jgi:DNA segregation ATPase FtsK/SpoIIIE, S-DNA-T family
MKPIRIVLSPTRSRPLNVFLGMLLLLVSLLVFLALATWRASDPSLNTAADPVFPHAARNWIGVFGAWTSDLLLQSFGLTAFLFPFCLGGIGWTWMHSRPGGSPVLRWMGILLAAAFLPAVFGLMPWYWHWLHLVPVEGVVGALMAGLLVNYLNIQGAWVVAGVLALAGIYLASAVSFWTLKESLQEYWLRLRSVLERWRNWREERAEARAEIRAEREIIEGREDDLPVHESPPKAEPRAARFWARFFRRRSAPELDPLDEIPAFQRAEVLQQSDEIPVVPPARRMSIWERDEDAPAAPAEPVSTQQKGTGQQKVAAIRPDPSYARTAEPHPAASRPVSSHPVSSHFDPPPAAQPRQEPRHEDEIAIHNRADADLRTATVAPKNLSGFKLPSSTLLHAGEGPQTIREEELREEAKVLVEKCAEFDVRGQVVQINPGPMVTTYEFKPEAGVKYSRVTGLADDLCLAMRAESILIERMAGKSTVGIQVPNHERETIHLRDVLESETFAKAKSRLTLAMGKDINGRIVTADLASMPHVLIAGSTGSGKSVAINAMIMSLLYRTTPAQVRLILVDPKRVELGMYEGIPHLFTPIITEPKLAANALRNAVREMERRLKLLASRSVRNIDQYNKLFEGTMPSLFDEGKQEEPLPYIVIIIDELADLMMLDRANVEESITRLAQMARAVGIHLVLATQRPSVDVITGLIKATSQRESASASPPRSTRAPSSTPTALRLCSAAATCSFFLPAPAACCACTRPT